MDHNKQINADYMATDENKIKITNVGIGEYHVGSFCMSSIGLGSCVALILHDQKRSVGALAHIMLPESRGDVMDRPGKFADTAVETLLMELISQGSNKRNIVATIVGGASMFKQFSGNLDIGTRNIEAVRKKLQLLNIPLNAEDVGENFGRSVYYHPLKNGKVYIRRANGTCTDI